MTAIGLIKLNDGNAIPELGLGFWKVENNAAGREVCAGVAAGYRLLDTAYLYRNEEGVGRGIAACGIPREGLFVTTKVWNTQHGYDETMRAFDDSMGRLGLEYLDLYLIHWPVAHSEKYIESWKAFIKLRADGRVRSIGVSNFLEHHIERLEQETGVLPCVNQIEFHPFFQPAALDAFNRSKGIVTESWAPLGRGSAIDEPALLALSVKYGKSPAQVVIRWHLQLGHIVIPKTSKPERMRENKDVYDFELTPEEMQTMANLDRQSRTGGHPDEYEGLDIN